MTAILVLQTGPVAIDFFIYVNERKVDVVARALASHQCGPGSNPGVDIICGLSLLLILFLAPRGFSPGTPVLPSSQKPTLPNSNSIWNARTQFKEYLRTPKCFVSKQITICIFFSLYFVRICLRMAASHVSKDTP